MPNSARPGGACSNARLQRSRPGEREPHAALDLGQRSRQLHALVELHDDVGTEQRLDLDRALGRELVRRAVEVGAECHARVLDLAQARERHHLEAAGIGKDRQRPVHEAMQAAERGHALGARPQHQVIGVGEYDVGARRPHLIRIHALHGRLGADRHERRRAHPSVRGGDLAQPRGAVGRQQFEEKAGRHRKEC